MWDNPGPVTALATGGFVLLWALTRQPEKLSRYIFIGLLVNLVFVSLFFEKHFSNIVIGKDIAAQVIGYTLLLLWVSHLFRQNAFTFAPTPLNIAVLIYFLAGVVSAFLAPRWTWYYTLEEISRNAAVVLMFFMLVKFMNTRSRWNTGLNAVLICMALTSVYAVLQINGYDFVEWGFRTNVSTFGNKDFFASYLTYAMPVALALAAGSANFFNAALYLAMTALALFNIVEGETRGAWVGLMALAAVTVCYEMTLGRLRGWLGNLKKTAVFWGSIALAAVVLIHYTPEHKIRTFKSIFQTHSGTNIIRVYIWWTSMRMWWDQPLTGQGIGTYQLTYPSFRLDRYHRIGMSHNTRHAHSEELELLAEQGILGFAAWAAVLVIFFYLSFKKLKKIGDPRERYLFYGIVSGLIAGLVHDSINVNLRWMSSATVFWFLLGLGTRYLIGFDPEPDKKAVRARPAAAQVWRWQVETPLLAVLTAAFALMFWMQYIVLRTDYLLRIVEGTVENPATQKLGIDTGKEVLRLSPYDHSAYYKTAYAYLQLNDIPSAKKMYDALIQLAPNYTQVHQNMALIAYRDYTLKREKKFLYQTLVEFEWAADLENNFENHTKLMQLYSQLANDIPRARYHNRYIFWEVLEDSFFLNYRLWSVFYQYTSRSAKEFKSMYDYHLKDGDEYNRQYWLYRTDTIQKLGRPRPELRHAIKMAVRYVPSNPNVLRLAAGELLRMQNPEEDLVYLINIMEDLRPNEAPPELFQQIRQGLIDRGAGGSAPQPLVAYALGVISQKLGEKDAAANYFRGARAGEAEFRLIRRGAKKYGI